MFDAKHAAIWAAKTHCEMTEAEAVICEAVLLVATETHRVADLLEHLTFLRYGSDGMSDELRG